MKKINYILFLCLLMITSSFAQESVSSYDSSNNLNDDLENQKCHKYRVLVSEAIDKYYDDTIGLAKALKPNLVVDESFKKEIESSIINKKNKINIELLIKKGFLKEKPANSSCSYYYNTSYLSYPDFIQIKCPIHDDTVNKSTTTTTATKINNYVVEKEIEVIKEPKGPCSDYLKDIAKSVDTYNRMYNGKMKELELSNLIISELLDSSKCPSSCLFTSVGDLSKDGYIKCLVHDLYSKDIDKKNSFQNINNYISKYKIRKEETQAYKKLVKALKESKDDENKFNNPIIKNANLETANRIKINVDLNPWAGEEALKIAKIVQEFFTEYFIFDNLISQHRITPITRIILNLKRNLCFDYIFLIGNDVREQWIIDEVKIEGDTAYVKHYREDKSNKYTVICKKINGNWYIDDVDGEKESFFSILKDYRLGVVKPQNLSVYSKDFGEKFIPFNDFYNRLVLFKKTDDINYYKIDNEMISFKVELDSESFIKSEDIIPFNFFNKIKKGEDKYLAYMVLGEPRKDSYNKLFYSPDDYISYDKNGKITSWVGFEDLKDFFDDGTGFNNQNIGYINTKSGVNMRTEPNTKSEKICGLPNNTRVMILDTCGPQDTFDDITSNWYFITDGIRFGWAFGGFIELNKNDYLEELLNE